MSCSTVGRTSLPLLFIILFTSMNDNMDNGMIHLYDGCIAP